MARKFVSLNHHSADDYINADVSWDKIQKFYITEYNRRNFRHASLSTAHFVAYIWRWGNQEWVTEHGDIPALDPNELELFKQYLRDGGGHVFYGMFNFETYPDNPTNFEEYINYIY